MASKIKFSMALIEVCRFLPQRKQIEVQAISQRFYRKFIPYVAPLVVLFEPSTVYFVHPDSDMLFYLKR